MMTIHASPRWSFCSGLWLTMLAATMALLAATGCRVHVDKDQDGKEKTVQVETPFGGIHVNTDKTSASDLGLPIYPGAKPSEDHDKHGSADVHMGFGQWQLRVKAVSYQTNDSEEKVEAFYKKALTRFGDVIVCRDKKPVGSPVTTREGLTCADDSEKNSIKVNEDAGRHIELKAGSKRHQHIVGFEDPKEGVTHFALVALDLPSGMGGDDDKQ